MEAAKPASARTLRPRATVEDDPAWKARSRKFERMPEDEQAKLLFAVLHRWPQRLERPVTSAAAETELRYANTTITRFNVTEEEIKNYRAGAAVFHKTATAVRDLAGRIKVEILRQGVSATRPWPESLSKDLQKLGPLVKVCADWRDVPTRMDARQHTGECNDRVDDEGKPVGKATDVSRCVLAHRRTEHFRTALDWCPVVRITEARCARPCLRRPTATRATTGRQSRFGSGTEPSRWRWSATSSFAWRRRPAIGPTGARGSSKGRGRSSSRRTTSASHRIGS